MFLTLILYDYWPHRLAVLFSRRNRSPVTVSAMTRSEVLRFPRDTVLSLCHSYRSVLTALLRDAGDRVVLCNCDRLFELASEWE